MRWALDVLCQVRELLGIIEDDGVESAMEAALKGSTQDMKDLVAERVRQLQVECARIVKWRVVDAPPPPPNFYRFYKAPGPIRFAFL